MLLGYIETKKLNTALNIMKTRNSIFKILFIGILFLAYNSVNAQERREIGNLVLEDVPEIPEEIKSRLQQYQNTRSASFVDWLPDGQGILISTRFGNTNQLHTVHKPGGSRNQITFFDEPVDNGLFSPSPDHNGFLFTKDTGGNEFSQIYWYNMKTGESEMISDGESVNRGVLWSNKGDRFAFSSTRRNKKDFDIYVSNISSPKEGSLKIDRGGAWIATDWSPDDTKLLVNQYISITNTNSFILNLKTNELTQISDDKKESVFFGLAWNKTGNKIYAITNEGREFNTLVEYDIKKKKFQYITDDIPWNVEWASNKFTTNFDNTSAAFTVNENGFSQLYLLDLQTGQYDKVSNILNGQINSLKFHPTKNELAIGFNTTNTPGDVYSLNLDSMNLERWTTSEVGGLNTSLFPKPELITFETFDEVDGKKRQIPAFVYKPQQVDGELPVMVLIHGGPEGQHRPDFSSFITFLTNELGIAVIAPNVRGSSGYGKTYLKLDNGFKREHSVQDIGKLIEWIERNPDFDENRIGVFGGSYGGYMVLSSMFNFNNKIKCGVDVVGISNFVTFLENTEEYRRDLRRAEYGDERDPEMRKFLESISPNNHADEITKPLFVIQGANDPRVPASESEQMVQAIRENGGTVWYMLGKNEGHGFRKKENRDYMLQAIAFFLKENLLKK